MDINVSQNRLIEWQSQNEVTLTVREWLKTTRDELLTVDGLEALIAKDSPSQTAMNFAERIGYLKGVNLLIEKISPVGEEEEEENP